MSARPDDQIQLISAQSGAAQTCLRALNNRHERETSFLDADTWRRLVEQAFAATASADQTGFLIAFDQAARYDSPNFAWFRSRFRRFVYVDRIVVAPEVRGRGVARLLYEDLFVRARSAGHARIVCEVNHVPPNPGSDAFHARLGFSEIGRAQLHAAKAVRYLERRL